MSAVLVGIGAGLFLFLGLAHAIFTRQSTPTGGPMMPTNPQVLAAMNTTGGIGMAPHIESNLFKAWIGFNYSHSLGVVVAAAVVLYHAIRDLGAAIDQIWFVVLVVAVPALYLLLAKLYWFDQPRNAIALGSLLIWVGLIVELL